jgi:hypothetical protein
MLTPAEMAAFTERRVPSVAARGGELVFDFIHPDALADTAPRSERTVLERTPAAAEVDRRYFATRTDGYRTRPMGHLASAGIV